MVIIDGNKIADEIIGELKKLPVPEKFMAAVLVGSDPASLSFIRQKEETAKKLGVDFRFYNLSAELNNNTLREEVRKIAEHKTCGGAIVQLPLPKQINRHYVLNAVPREKDVDVLGERSIGAFYAERNPILPPSVGTVKTILENRGLKIEDCRVAVVGLGLLVGRPIGLWLMRKAKEIILFDAVSDLSGLKNADLVISGTGKAGIIKQDMLKDDAGVIDFSYAKEDKVMTGDLDTSSDLSKLAFYTPTPGGTGPILVAKLFENFYKLNGLS
ncbi:MAG: bifunctional 5,10-methylenetetrahydrofolate dehydrogenase/5,10-methenyltetrahydrofolate cyclohydrolase [Candidatus Liptonbacteria bacterium]|nr:bifunctional 5,10-methylenetetrahydrofolate dehydrogenase/5,10-methenyltetrahydrofolate cyclohydrolase [Candidatus Liptonbacteria bacterium]